MGNIRVLDCTLRDGGYCNEWNFGNKNIKSIISGLTEAQVDIIECGFLTNRIEYDANITKYVTVEEVAAVIPNNRLGAMYVCMMNYGEYDVEDLPMYDGSSIDGIRVAFHKKDMNQALQLCKKVKAKGYKVFVQAMVSLNYSDEEFLELIHKVNEISPYSFYIVDSFGVMKRKDLIRLFYLVEHNLSEGISIGYHSHNNMQLAYSNAQALADIKTVREMIFDSSIFGMGRGAGNLNTELFVEYLNDNFNKNYHLKYLLAIIDEILMQFYQQNYWGYSLPNYLSAKHNTHPNYAGYLDFKKTLTVENMDEIFTMMDDAKRSSYDKAYIEKLYLKYMAAGDAKETHIAELKANLKDKNILIIAPGRSSLYEKEKVIALAQKDNTVSIGVNFDYTEWQTDYIFVSNLRRFRELDKLKHNKCIVTSNIPSIDIFLQTNYKDLLNENEAVRDNAGMMLIKFLINMGVKKLFIAGMDGYSIDADSNYADPGMTYYMKRAVIEAMNNGMNTVLRDFSKKIEINFITEPKHIFLTADTK